VAATKKVGCVHNVFRNATAGEEAGMVVVNQGVDSFLKPGGEDLRDGFHHAVLEGVGSEKGWMKGNVCFGKEDQKGTVYPTEVNSAIVEGIKHRYDIWGNYIPEGSEERRAKPVRARAGELVHG
jgi:hypothetical protein